MKLNFKEREKGITLIALVITIFLKGIVKKQKVKYNEKENERKGGKNK